MAAYAWLGVTVVGLVFAVAVTWEARKDLAAARLLDPNSLERVAARNLYVGQLVRCGEFAAMLTVGVVAAANLRGYGIVRGGLILLAGLITLNTFLAWRDGRTIAAELQKNDR